MFELFFIASAAFIIVLLTKPWKNAKAKKFRPVPTPQRWKDILNKYVNFYRNLDDVQKLQFESDVQRFLSEVRITGVRTNVELTDRLLVASSAVVPLFGFPAWNYSGLDEVLLYPSPFDRRFRIESRTENITGMVGEGHLDGKVIFSKPDLRRGFEIFNDKNNVGYHEFVHLFDKESGLIDAVPPGFNHEYYSLPWLAFVRKKIREIEKGESDIHPYGATEEVEFFAVASEYFFERPNLLKEKHPRLYHSLQKIFNQDMTAIIKRKSFQKQKTPGRNDRCLCGSGQKYKHCCGGA